MDALFVLGGTGEEFRGGEIELWREEVRNRSPGIDLSFCAVSLAALSRKMAFGLLREVLKAKRGGGVKFSRILLSSSCWALIAYGPGKLISMKSNFNIRPD